jgi:G:T-mismatch repair DNA endonuclease (very short patch repair protein)
MIIFDFNQVAISNLMEQIGSSKTQVEESLVRHMILNTIRTYVKKFKSTHGPEVVIACDNKNYWRREIFPHYKAGRKKAREASGHDWNTIFECINKIRDELKNNSPYKVIEVHTCEADDIIAVLAARHAANEKVMILSSDKDFAQLQRFSNVEQYSPILKKYIKEPLPALQLKQLVIRGDKSDGIPNILSADDVFVAGGRQKPITEAKIIKWHNQDPKEFCEGEMYRNYSRNETLIDLTKIPENLKQSIIDSYESAVPNSKQKFMNYMIANRLKNLLEVIDEF